jgi:hypothetical protein
MAASKKKKAGKPARAATARKKGSRKTVKSKAKKKATRKTSARKAKAPARKAKKKTARKTARKPAAKAAPARRSAAKAPARSKAPARKKKAQQIVGEGDYAATRAFDADQAAFVKRNKGSIPDMGRQAEAALDGPQGKDLREAEAEALARSRDTF